MADFLAQGGLLTREVARRLEMRRIALGLSKLGLAQRAGLDQRTITFIEEGKNSPSLTTLFAICRALEIRVGTLVSAADRALRDQNER